MTNSIQSTSQNSNLLSFLFNDKPLRILRDDSNNPRFCLKDLCDALDIKNVSQAASAVNANEKGICNVDTLGGKQDLLFISEKAMYKLVFRSNKPEAEEYADWVAGVLVEIRETGGYQSKEISPMDILRQMFVTYDKQQAENEQRFSALEGHVQGLDHDVQTLMQLYPDTYTVKGYFNHIGRKQPDIATLRAIGKLAKANSGRKGMVIRVAQEGQYTVNMYHETILRDVVAGWDNDNQSTKPIKQLKF